MSIRLASLGNISLELLEPRLAKAAEAAGIALEAWTAPFGRYRQEVLDPQSELRRYDPDLVFLALDLRELRPRDHDGMPRASTAARRALADDVLAEVEEWRSAALEATRASLLIADFPLPARPRLGLADTAESFGERDFFEALNRGLRQALRDDPRSHAFGLEELSARIGRSAARDARLRFLAGMPWSAGLQQAIAEELVRWSVAIHGPIRKCVVVDLDNTLWGGVVGEDGWEALRIGGGDPAGEAYAEFQRRLHDLTGRGILLAAASKNREADVFEVFENRPEMILARDDFAAMEIHWEGKDESLRRIAAGLGIGLDSLVFVDDNPAEVLRVREALPEITCVQLPTDPSDFPAALDAVLGLDRPALLDEDREKTVRYRQEAARKASLGSSTDLGTYLESLEIEVTLRRTGTPHRARAVQLFQKTNQFNLTTQRHDAAAVDDFLGDPAWELWQAEARDRFGDLGTIGLALLRHEGDRARLDSFLLSCRALGRGIETALMNHVKGRVVARGGQVLEARFVPTDRNEPAADFLPAEGFEEAGGAYTWTPSESSAGRESGWLRVEIVE